MKPSCLIEHALKVLLEASVQGQCLCCLILAESLPESVQ